MKRFEEDSMGRMQIPQGALWGAQTQRAIENFPISGQRLGPHFFRAMGHIKGSCARVNMGSGALPADLGRAIVQACEQVIDGTLADQFPLDVFQTGSGTSTNMNVNEVIANRANLLLGGQVGTRSPVHPNDHVNMGQSSNDVFPTAIHIAASLRLREALLPALANLHAALEAKAAEFDHIIKSGRTHLQDATPVRLGQEFGGYARQARLSVGRAEQAIQALRELPLGGTAVGTGLNRAPDFPAKVIADLNAALGADFVEAADHMEANAARDGVVEASGQLKTIAVSLTKIANDIRWMGSGPRNGLGEIRLPAVQPGSSIMPGKVNPVIAEALIQVAAQVIGNDAAITLGGLGGYFELNLMQPLMAYNLLNSIEWLANAVQVFSERCVAGIEADEERCRAMTEQSLAMATSLAPVIGYDQAAQISKEAHRTGKTVREVATEMGAVRPEVIERALDPWRMTQPGD